jgi:hypothetical protein
VADWESITRIHLTECGEVSVHGVHFVETNEHFANVVVEWFDAAVIAWVPTVTLYSPRGSPSDRVLMLTTGSGNPPTVRF